MIDTSSIENALARVHDFSLNCHCSKKGCVPACMNTHAEEDNFRPERKSCIDVIQSTKTSVTSNAAKGQPDACIHPRRYGFDPGSGNPTVVWMRNNVTRCLSLVHGICCTHKTDPSPSSVMKKYSMPPGIPVRIKACRWNTGPERVVNIIVL